MNDHLVQLIFGHSSIYENDYDNVLHLYSAFS